MKYYILRDTFTASAFDVEHHDLKAYYLEEAYQGDAILAEYDSLESALADFPAQSALVRDIADMEDSDYKADICMVCTVSLCDDGELDQIDEEFACTVSRARTYFMPIKLAIADCIVNIDRFLSQIEASYNGTFVDTDAWIEEVFDNLDKGHIEIPARDSRHSYAETIRFDVHYNIDGTDEDGFPIYGDDVTIEF